MIVVSLSQPSNLVHASPDNAIVMDMDAKAEVDLRVQRGHECMTAAFNAAPPFSLTVTRLARAAIADDKTPIASIFLKSVSLKPQACPLIMIRRTRTPGTSLDMITHRKAAWAVARRAMGTRCILSSDRTKQFGPLPLLAKEDEKNQLCILHLCFGGPPTSSPRLHEVVSRSQTVNSCLF
jgi:hypothetical protein